MSQQLPLVFQVRQLQPTAVASWWQAGHPGWAIYPVDSEMFMATGALDTLHVQHEQVAVPSHGAPGAGALARCALLVVGESQ